MHTKKQHIVRKTIIVSVSFLLGIVSTVIAAATYDANIQTRATKMFNTIKSNASTLATADQQAYYTLVRLNIQSLIQVLTSVDSSLMLELGTTQELDDDTITGQITNTGTSTNTGATSCTPANGCCPSWKTVVNGVCVVITNTTNTGSNNSGTTTTSTGTVATPVACTGIGNSFNFSNSDQTKQCIGVMPAGNRWDTKTVNATQWVGTATVTCGLTGWSVTAGNCTTDKNASSGTSTENSTNTTSNAGNNSVPWYLVARQDAAKFCKINFYNEWFTTITQNIQKSIDSTCTSGRCLISKFYWVAWQNTSIFEDREEYWGQSGVIDYIKCNSDNWSNTSIRRYNPQVKKQCQWIKADGTQDFVWLDSNNQVSQVIQSCTKPLNGWLSCNEWRWGCCPDGQVSINTQCVTQSDTWGYCYTTTQCKVGLLCWNYGENKNKCYKDTTTYSWVESISDCRSDGETEFGGKKHKSFICKWSNGATSFNWNDCLLPKPADEDIVCTMTTSAAKYSGLIFKYSIPYIEWSYGDYGPIYEWDSLSISEVKADKCIGTNCTKVDIPRLDIEWTMTITDNQSSWNNGIVWQGTHWITKWGKLLMYINTKIDNIGWWTSKTGDLVTYDYWDASGERKITVTWKVKDPTKYPSLNPLKHEFKIQMKNKFDFRLTKTDPLMSWHSSGRIFIEFLWSDGYNGWWNMGLYYYDTTCNVTSSNTSATPAIQYLDANNWNISSPSPKFRILWLDNAAAWTMIMVTCTLKEKSSGITRTMTLSETASQNYGISTIDPNLCPAKIIDGFNIPVGEVGQIKNISSSYPITSWLRKTTQEFKCDTASQGWYKRGEPIKSVECNSGYTQSWDICVISTPNSNSAPTPTPNSAPTPNPLSSCEAGWPATWMTNCSGSWTAASHSGIVSVVNTNPGYTWVYSAMCNNGTWTFVSQSCTMIMPTCATGYIYNANYSACIKTTKVALDCNNTTTPSGWYKEYLWKCWDVEGMAYWNSQISTNGATNTYNVFKSTVDGIVGQMSKQNYLNGALCETGATYILNTNYCKK